MSEFDLKTEIINRVRLLQSDLQDLMWGHEIADPSLSYALECTQVLERMVQADKSIFAIEPWHKLTSDGMAQGPSELLLRLVDHEGKGLPPYDFIMACYRKTLSARLDMITALAGLYEYAGHFRPNGEKQVSVNISARFLEPRNRDNIQALLAVLEGLDLDGGYIFEIHESASNTDISPAIMQMFHERGVRFAIDDVTLNVGDIFRISGFREFVDYVKLDRSFVQSHDSNADLFKNMVDFIRNNVPRAQVVAEGVKDAAHALRLHQAHKDIVYVQGRDLPERDVFLEKWNKISL